MRSVLILLLLLFSFSAMAEEPIVGAVKTLSGTANVRRNGSEQQLQSGMAICEQDLVETGDNGQVGITFRDNSRLAIGPNSRVAVSHFVFKPAQRQYGFVVQLLHGTLEYISGLTGKLSPNSISIETPTSTIAVRGTHLLTRAE
ncbi:MAG: FecR domain-containing protein [Alphaproteobacteria bacterium]|nr:FecR domain-containing protein [Alphaproteobacteria bacterium]